MVLVSVNVREKGRERKKGKGKSVYLVTSLDIVEAQTLWNLQTPFLQCFVKLDTMYCSFYRQSMKIGTSRLKVWTLSKPTNISKSRSSATLSKYILSITLQILQQ